jgi:hypothetical protein
MSAPDPSTIARELAAKLAATARDRDRLGGTPRAERALVRDSGLLKIGIPVAWGGGGASWPTIMQVTQILAAADSSMAQVYGFQHVLLATCQLFGAPEQARRLLEATAANNWFWGNSLNPLDRRLFEERRKRCAAAPLTGRSSELPGSGLLTGRDLKHGSGRRSAARARPLPSA